MLIIHERYERRVSLAGREPTVGMAMNDPIRNKKHDFSEVHYTCYGKKQQDLMVPRVSCLD
jgi:hypothetical protein